MPGPTEDTVNGLNRILADLQHAARPARPASPPAHRASGPAIAELPVQAPADSGADASHNASVDAESVRDLVKTMNREPVIVNSGVRFRIDDDTGRLAIRVVDAVSEEIIREIPSKELQQAWRRLEKFQEAMGLVIDREM